MGLINTNSMIFYWSEVSMKLTIITELEFLVSSYRAALRSEGQPIILKCQDIGYHHYSIMLSRWHLSMTGYEGNNYPNTSSPIRKTTDYYLTPEIAGTLPHTN